jgi:hypothetical protein
MEQNPGVGIIQTSPRPIPGRVFQRIDNLLRVFIGRFLLQVQISGNWATPRLGPPQRDLTLEACALRHAGLPEIGLWARSKPHDRSGIDGRAGYHVAGI